MHFNQARALVIGGTNRKQFTQNKVLPGSSIMNLRDFMLMHLSKRLLTNMGASEEV